MTNEVVLGADCRTLRHHLAPLDWMVVEELGLLAAVDDAGQLCAITSVRQMAEHLGCDAGAVAKALARLRGLGLVDHQRQVGQAGRFGPSVYVLGAVAGLRVVTDDSGPVVVLPQAATPRLVAPRTGNGAVGPPDLRRVRASSSGAPAPVGGDQLGLFGATGGEREHCRRSTAGPAIAMNDASATTRDARRARTPPPSSPRP